MDKNYNTSESYSTSWLTSSEIDTLGNVLTEITTMPDSDSILYSKRFIYDENFNLIKIFRVNLLSVEFEYDESNRVNRRTTFKYDGSIWDKMYFDYIYKHNEKLKDLLSHYNDGRIDSVISRNYTCVFKNTDPIQLYIYHKKLLSSIYKYDNKGRILLSTDFREDGDTSRFIRNFYNDENSTKISEHYVINEYSKYLYKFDERGNLVNTYRYTTDDSVKLVLSQEFDKNNNRLVVRNYEEDSLPYFCYSSYNSENKVISFLNIQNNKISFQRNIDYYSNGLIKCEKEYEGSKIIKEVRYTYEYY
jgi:hypothetical protein